MTTSNKNFKVKNGLEVLGATATVNGEDVLTTASNIQDLANVDITGVLDGYVIVYDQATSSFTVGAQSGGGGGGGTSIYVGSTEPLNPADDSLWFNTVIGRLLVRYNDSTSTQWVSTSGTAAQPVITALNDLTDVNLASLANGDIIRYNSTTGQFENTKDLDAIIKLNPQTISTDMSIPSGYNGMTVGPVTVANGITVTIADGSAWSIV